MEERLQLVKPVRNRRYTRQSADKALEMVKERIEDVNRNPEFLYDIDKAVVFGSYINTENDYVGDLDIALYTSFRGDPDDEVQANEHRAHEMGFNGNMVMAMIYGREEVAKYIKNRKQIISFHNGYEVDKQSESYNEKNYIFWDKSETIYEREKEAVGTL